MPRLGHLRLVLLFCAVGSSIAQTNNGSGAALSGVVTDATGASLPKARVVLIDLASLQTQSSEVPGDGRFAFRNLKPGEYALIVAGPASPHSACWQPAVRQIRVRGAATEEVRVPLLLDNERCPQIIE